MEAPGRVSIGRSLALPDTQGGILIGFATAPGGVAADGEGDHSPFTLALLDNLDAKGVEIEQMFKHVKREVLNRTGNKQQPWINSSLTDDFYFNP